MKLMLFMALFAVLNRARGSKTFELFNSTTAARIVATLGMAVLTMLASQTYHPNTLVLWVWGTLYLWTVPGWGKYFGACVGGRFNSMETEFVPVDWLMVRLPYFRDVYLARASDTKRRLWGTVAMGLRMSLAAPCVIGISYIEDGNAWPAIYTLLLGVPYLIAGYVFRANHILYAELAVGCGLALIIWNAI
jgi:hypothetical protein